MSGLHLTGNSVWVEADPIVGALTTDHLPPGQAMCRLGPWDANEKVPPPISRSTSGAWWALTRGQP